MTFIWKTKPIPEAYSTKVRVICGDNMDRYQKISIVLCRVWIVINIVVTVASARTLLPYASGRTSSTAEEPAPGGDEYMQLSKEEPLFLTMHESNRPERLLLKRMYADVAGQLEEMAPDFKDCATPKPKRNNLWSYCAALGFRRRKDANAKCMNVMARVLRSCEQEREQVAET
ncbi:uncharacterized protein LOC129588639 isoform X2 [Paramacrobiotus metropolitanus]|uniref:uncharacterized protein LOC129588639 isoform X2 n=1 Tax=Paramacrobiotus metropolitanus TaxID=2943436 RepID=UPI0024458BA3|nr:uncharacterized protein LOC129588639 isoform X2 [Paramacrobiotus metropolitanus]